MIRSRRRLAVALFCVVVTATVAGGAGGTVDGASVAAVDAPGSIAGTGSGTLELGDRGWAEAPDQSSLDLRDSFTIEFWVKFNASSDEDAVVLTKGGERGRTDGNYLVTLEGDGPNRTVRFGFTGLTDVTSERGIRAGRWTHVALTYDGSVLALYLDGKRDALVAASGSAGTNDDPLRIGTGAGVSHFLDGRVDDLRLWNDARTGTEIETDYLRELSGTEQGLSALYQFDGDLTDDAGTADLSANGDAGLTAIDAHPIPPRLYTVPGNGSVTLNWTERLGPNGENGADRFRLYRDGSVIDTVTGTSYVDAPGTDANGEPHTYRVRSVDANGTAGDYSSAAVETPYATRGGGSLAVDGQGRAQAPDQPSLDVRGEFTLEFWVKYDADSDEDAVVLTKGGERGRTDGNYLVTLEGDGPNRTVRFGFTGLTDVTSERAIPAEHWTHVALTYDGDALVLYLDGRPDVRVAASGSPNANDDPLRIGTDRSTAGHFLDGRVDDLRLWRDARSAAEIRRRADRELVGNEQGLSAYWRFDDAGAASARGNGRAHLTVDLEARAALSAPGALPAPPVVYARGDDGEATVVWTPRGSGNPGTVNLYRSSGDDRSRVASLNASRRAVFTDTGLANGVTHRYEATVVDPLGRESDLSFPATAVPSSDPAGTAFAFDGRSSSATVDDRSAVDPGARFAVEFWVRYDADSDEDAVVLSKGGEPGRTDGSYLVTLEGDGPNRTVRFGFGGLTDVTSNRGIRADRWTHVALTYDGDALVLYLDGERDVRVAASGSPNANDDPLRIGTDRTTAGHFLDGQVDDLRLWNDARTDREIRTYRERELLGDEQGLTVYLRGCQDASGTASGLTRRPMTATLNAVDCVDSTAPLRNGGVTSSLVVTIDGAPDGLRAYNVTVEPATPTTVRRIEPELIDGASFTVGPGGAGTRTVTAAAVDRSGTVGSFDDERTLFAVEYAGLVTPEDVSVTVDELVADGGSTVSSDRISLANATGDTPDAPDLTGNGLPALDPDGDGRYEDVDGDGQFNVIDVAAFLRTFDRVRPGDVGPFDFNGDATINIVDVAALLAET